jgi:cytochrome oxidase Cu insertion factor (SCO1/SenC/PrrC family)
MFLRNLAIALVTMCPLLASQATPQLAQPTPQLGQPAPRVGQPAPDFSLNDSTGLPVKLSGYKGKVVLLDFWAT